MFLFKVLPVAMAILNLAAAKYNSGAALEQAVAMLTGPSAAASGPLLDGGLGSAGSAAYPLAMPEFVQSSPSYQATGGAQVPAAIQTRRTVEVKPITLQSDPIEPHIVDVEASFQPVQVIFRSSSSPVMVQQIHTPAQPIHVEPTQSEDEPHRVQHQVMRPVIQEIREIIQPYRRVLQEIRPVLEEVRTVVAKASDSSGAAAAGSAGGLGGGAGMGGGAGAGGPIGIGEGAPIVLGGTGDAYSGAASAPVMSSAGSTYGSSRARSSSLTPSAAARKNYSRRSGMAKTRHYLDRARS